jgi:phosphohistidine phosphatase
MKTLLVMRHAKSSWKDASIEDHDRPLNERGSTAAPRMGKLLAELGLVPDAIVSSSALRALATARAVANACGHAREIQVRHDLYLAAPSAYADALRALEPAFSRVLVVGHNPGVEELIAELSGENPRMPTAALALIELPIARWSDLALDGKATLAGRWKPRQLA